MTLGRILHTNINVTDLERSVAFYERLGFTRLGDFAFDTQEAAAPCAAFGIPPTAYRGAMLGLGTDPAATFLDLIEWAQRPAEAPPPSVANGTGLYRVAITTDDLPAIVALLKAEGVPLLGPPATIRTVTGDTCTLCAFRDPDGTVIELVG